MIKPIYERGELYCHSCEWPSLRNENWAIHPTLALVYLVCNVVCNVGTVDERAQNPLSRDWQGHAVYTVHGHVYVAAARSGWYDDDAW